MVLKRSWEDLRGHLGASWGHLGGISEHLGGISRHLGGILKHLGSLLEHLENIFGASWSILLDLGGNLGLLGASWRHLRELTPWVVLTICLRGPPAVCLDCWVAETICFTILSVQRTSRGLLPR